MNKIIICTFVLLSNLLTAQTAEKSSFQYAPRPDEQIKKQFPFDIPLSDIKDNITNSAKVLANNDKPLVVFFWMTTCGPCREELTAIKGKYEAWQKEAPFRMIAMSIDFPQRHEAFKNRVDTEGWLWEAYHDWNREFTAVMPEGLNGVPQVFLFDKNGKIVYHHRKYWEGDEDELFQKIKEVIKIQ